MRSSLLSRLCHRNALGGLAVLVPCVLILSFFYVPHQSGSPDTAGTRHLERQHVLAGPPWRYGRADARFTVVLYGDLECPYCKSYFPVLKAWIDRYAETNLQWHHLPLPMHEPAASRQARLAECAGESEGHAAFWQAVTWIYEQTRSDGMGIPDSVSYPELTPTMQTCLNSRRAEEIVQAQASEGFRDKVTATPTVKLINNQNGQMIVLPGPVEDDALLSALDLLSTESTTENSKISADHE